MGVSKSGSVAQIKPEFASKNVEVYQLKDDAVIPNNPKLPVLIYRKVFQGEGAELADEIEARLEQHHWGGYWRNGIYSYHHYHSTAHEVLLVYAGSAKVQLGGEDGITTTIESGDVVLIPAGVAHKNLGSSEDFGVVGAYPEGQDWNMCYGKRSERPQADRQIAQVPLPKMDPVFGGGGPLLRIWKFN